MVSHGDDDGEHSSHDSSRACSKKEKGNANDGTPKSKCQKLDKSSKSKQKHQHDEDNAMIQRQDHETRSLSQTRKKRRCEETTNKDAAQAVREGKTDSAQGGGHGGGRGYGGYGRNRGAGGGSNRESSYNDNSYGNRDFCAP